MLAMACTHLPLGFLSTPSARRATPLDIISHLHPPYFYPRPPRGGRQDVAASVALALQFLSTPSARRATLCCRCLLLLGFISIHALREEGD